MKRICLTVFACCLAPVFCFADQPGVYESIDDIAIGRVFLTSAQRNWLDLHRHDVPIEASVAPANEIVPKINKPAISPAGYIIKSDGSRRHWSNGDFVTSNNAALVEMKFPGDIKIVRHSAENETESESTKKTAPKVKTREGKE